MIQNKFRNRRVMDLDLLNASLLIEWIWKHMYGASMVGIGHSCKKCFVCLDISKLWVCEISDELLTRTAFLLLFTALKQLSNISFSTRCEHNYFVRLLVLLSRLFVDLTVQKLFADLCIWHRKRPYDDWAFLLLILPLTRVIIFKYFRLESPKYHDLLALLIHSTSQSPRTSFTNCLCNYGRSSL